MQIKFCFTQVEMPSNLACLNSCRTQQIPSSIDRKIESFRKIVSAFYFFLEKNYSSKLK
jgi:hypothetical protein